MNLLKKISFLFSITSILVLLTSCTVVDWFGGRISDEEISELDSQLEAGRRKTLLDESLFKFGRMLVAYDVPSTPIQSKNIGNETADKSAPSNLYVMIATAINKIGSEVVFIPYDVQYIVGEETTGGTINRMFPEAVVSGGITGMDKELIEKERSGEIEGGWSGAKGGANYESGEGVSRITVDLNMLDYTSQSYYPGVLSSNSILIRKDKMGWGLSAAYMDFSLSFDSEVKTKQGLYNAFRFLVELSVLELFGKYFNVPYWRCVKGASADMNMVNRLKDNFEGFDNNIQVLYLKKFLFLNGYKNIDRDSEKLLSGEQAVLNSAMQINGVNNYADLFIKLWTDLPLTEARRIVITDRKDRKKEQLLKERKARHEAEKKVESQKEEQAAKAKEEIKLKQLANKKYTESLKKGDTYFKAGKYSNAMQQYIIALKNRPKDQYSLNQLARVRKIIETLKKREAQYRATVSKGDKYFSQGNYPLAKIEYQNAMRIKPKQTYLINQLDKVNKILKNKNPIGVGRLSESDWDDDGY